MNYKHPGYEELHILECGYIQASGTKRAPGDTVRCHRHGHYVDILRTEPGYIIKCGGCSYTRSFGAAKLTAQYAADKHAKKFPLHTVAVKLGRQTIDVRRPRTIMVELPFAADDSPPF